MSGTPLGPTVPTVAPSSIVVPRRTRIEPRWTRVTAYPVGVWIVTVLPPFGTVPANDTTPPAAARTGVPVGAPMSIPRCWPAAYGSLPKENGRRTGPSTGHVQAEAAEGAASATSRTTTMAKQPGTRMSTTLLSELITKRHHTGAVGCCQHRLQRRVVEAPPREACELGDQLRRP